MLKKLANKMAKREVIADLEFKIKPLKELLANSYLEGKDDDCRYWNQQIKDYQDFIDKISQE